jgi:hypothetical protein
MLLRADAERVHARPVRSGDTRVVLVRLHPREVGPITLAETIVTIEHETDLCER